VRLLAVSLLAGCAAPALRAGPDRDGDGLDDLLETHVYRTDPERADTDGDGVQDGDPDERREFTYSIRTRVRVMQPVNLDAIDDDFQDARVLSAGEEVVELEVVHYPLATLDRGIAPNPRWRSDVAGMRELAAGASTNWDAGMRDALAAELRAKGIDVEAVDDEALARAVAAHALSRARFVNMFCTYFVHFPEGRARVLRGLEVAFEANKGDPRWTPSEQIEREVLGRGMFERRTYGTCTSTAIYLTTVLRAAGLPARMVLCIPPVDPSDPAQIAMVEAGVTHHRVRAEILAGLASCGGFTAHTFNEVFVGGRWRRLNYSTLGQGILDRDCLGLLTHVHTFNDLAEAGLASTWGRRYAMGERDAAFPGANPYRAIAVDDRFGAHAGIANPRVPEHRTLTVSRATWLADAPAGVRNANPDPGDGAGRVWLHVEEALDGADYTQYKPFLRQADPNFILRAEGHPDVRARVSGSFYTDFSNGLREFELVVAPEAFAAVAQGVDYALYPVNGRAGWAWRVGAGVVLRR
jgi:hypothetical protein